MGRHRVRGSVSLFYCCSFTCHLSGNIIYPQSASDILRRGHEHYPLEEFE